MKRKTRAITEPHFLLHTGSTFKSQDLSKSKLIEAIPIGVIMDEKLL